MFQRIWIAFVSLMLVGASALAKPPDDPRQKRASDLADSAAKLVAAVAAQGAQEVAGEALGMEPRQGCGLALGLAHQDRVLLGPPIGRPERHDAHLLGIGQRQDRKSVV